LRAPQSRKARYESLAMVDGRLKLLCQQPNSIPSKPILLPNALSVWLPNDCAIRFCSRIVCILFSPHVKKFNAMRPKFSDRSRGEIAAFSDENCREKIVFWTRQNGVKFS